MAETPDKLSYETMCKIVGHLVIQSRLELDTVYQELGVVQQERDQLLNQLANRQPKPG